MNTIANYLDTMFIKFPETPEISQLKVDLLANMEDKYNELKAAGKSENEAIGTVIAEFGNIDELIEEMNLESSETTQDDRGEQEELPLVDSEIVMEYFESKKKIGLGIGAGVLSCAVGVAGMLAIQAFTDQHSPFLSMIPLFILVAIGVGLFIVSGYRNSKYEYLEKEFVITGATRQMIGNLKKNYERSYIFGLVLGITLCIVSILPIFLSLYIWPENSTGQLYGVSLFLAIAGVGVLFIVFAGNMMAVFNTLLTKGKSRQPTKQELKDRKINHVFDNVYWPIIVLLFFVLGFTGVGWGFGSSWIVFPIGGILQEAIKALLGVTSE